MADRQLQQYLSAIGASAGANVQQAATAAENGGDLLAFVALAGLGHLPEHQQRLAYAAATLPQTGPLTAHAALAVFEAMKSLGHEIPFSRVEEGCFARAQLMGDAMRSVGLDPGKVWALPGVEGPHFAGLLWEYHVAPTVQCQAGGGVETGVIDPSIATAPQRINEWMTAIGLEDHLWYSAPLTPGGLAAAVAQCAAGEQGFYASNGDPALAQYPRGIAVETPWGASPDGRGGQGYWWRSAGISATVPDPVGDLSDLARAEAARIFRLPAPDPARP